MLRTHISKALCKDAVMCISCNYVYVSSCTVLGEIIFICNNYCIIRYSRGLGMRLGG